MADWICCRQRAGNLVKECRALRPRFSAADTAEDRAAKRDIKRHQRCAVNRNPKDKLELYLALLGSSGTHYTLTFDDRHLPDTFYGVRRKLSNFFKRVQRWRVSLGKPPPFDYIYAIEGLHGDHRYHAHFVADYYELCPAEVGRLWTGGNVIDEKPVLRTRRFLDPTTNERARRVGGAARRADQNGGIESEMVFSRGALGVV